MAPGLSLCGNMAMKAWELLEPHRRVAHTWIALGAVAATCIGVAVLVTWANYSGVRP